MFLPKAITRSVLLFFSFLPTVLLGQQPERVTANQAFQYRLESGKHKVCSHMLDVYNKAFREPWNYDTWAYPPPWFPPLSADQPEPKVRSGLLSRYPESNEFDAIEWRESIQNNATVLIAKFDIDNNGRDDFVVKFPHFSPWREGADDYIFVLYAHQLAPDKEGVILELPNEIRKGRSIGYAGLGYFGSSIRPFIYEGVSYMSVYDSRPPRAMRVLKYKGGGESIDGKTRKPLDVEELCHFRMLLSNG